MVVVCGGAPPHARRRCIGGEGEAGEARDRGERSMVRMTRAMMIIVRIDAKNDGIYEGDDRGGRFYY